MDTQQNKPSQPSPSQPSSHPSKDSQPSPSQPSSHPSKDSQPSPRQSSSGLYRFFMGFAFLLALVSMAAAFYFWQQSQEKQTNAKRDDTQLTQAIEQLKATQAQQYQIIMANQARIDKMLANPRQGGVSDQTLLMEVDQIIRQANAFLTTANSPKTALQLLNGALELLGKSEDPRFLALKQALNSDIGRLAAMPNFDPASIMAKIGSLSDQIGQLIPIPGRSQAAAIGNAALQQLPPEAGRVLDTIKTNLMNFFQKLVVVRNNEGPASQSLFAGNSLATLKEAVRLKLSQAEWAVLHQEPGTYQNLIQQATQMLDKYGLDSATVNQIKQQLQQLYQVNVKPNLPTALQSLPVLSDLFLTQSTSPQLQASPQFQALPVPSSAPNATPSVRTQP